MLRRRKHILPVADWILKLFQKLQNWLNRQPSRLTTFAVLRLIARILVKVLTARLLRALLEGQEREGYPQKPVLLSGNHQASKTFSIEAGIVHDQNQPITTRINGREYLFNNAHRKTLLRLLRERCFADRNQGGV